MTEMVLAVMAMILSAATAIAAVCSVVSARASSRTANRAYVDAKRIYVLHPKRDVLRRLVAQSYRLTEGHSDRNDAMAVINEAAVVYGESETVMGLLAAIKDRKELASSFDPLIRAMAQASEISLNAVRPGWFATASVSGATTVSGP